MSIYLKYVWRKQWNENYSYSVDVDNQIEIKGRGYVASMVLMT